MIIQIIYRSNLIFEKKSLIHLVFDQGQGEKVYRWKLSVIEDLQCARIITVIILSNSCVTLCYNAL